MVYISSHPPDEWLFTVSVPPGRRLNSDIGLAFKEISELNDMSTTYLITGANRGIGKGLVEAYLSQPNNIVIAAVRDPLHPTSKALNELPKAPSSSLVVVKIDSLSETDAAAAVEELNSAHGITALDVVVANAGIATVLPLVQDAKTTDLRHHFQVNVLANVVLFQAVLPLLKKSSKAAKFVTMSSGAGSMELIEKIPIPNAVYGTSKAALNYLTVKIHSENKDIIAFPVHPGFVQTDMGNTAAVIFGMEKADITVEESIAGIVKLIDNATKESTSGKFLSYDGTTIPW